MLSPEQIAYIREWAKSGNEPRKVEELGDFYHSGLWTNRGIGFHAQLNSAGLTIAALSEALEQANETAEELRETAESELKINGETLNGIDRDLLEIMRTNRKALLG